MHHGTAPLQIDYDGPEPKSVFSRSQSRWQAALHSANAIQQLPESSFDLERILFRTPSLPKTIPSDATSIQGYSAWTNRNPSCHLRKAGKPRKFVLRRTHPVKCSISSSPNFSVWEDTPNNGIALLVLGWAYVFTADLAERQTLTMEYRWAQDNPSDIQDIQPTVLRLDYALPRERAWWKAIVTRGMGWSITGAPGDTKVSPWAVEVDDVGLDIAGVVDTSQRPPVAREAACYLARLCRVFGLGRRQCSAALAAALTFPLQASYVARASAKIELPRPSLTQRCSSDPKKQEDPPAEYLHLGFYMSLSLCPGIFGPLLWSIFWEPDVPCHCAGAWLVPIANILRPIVEGNNLEHLARVLSFTRTPVAPLWLGLALCGPRGIIKSVMHSITTLADYPHTKPDMDSAAWTGIAQSFLHIHSSGPYLQVDGTVSRAHVWRLRHDCYDNYDAVTFEHPPPHGWPPFGKMREQDVELEIRSHLSCSPEWAYSHWTWLPANVTGVELSTIDTTCPTWPPPGQSGTDGGELQQCEFPTKDVCRVSEEATRKVFWWACSQVEKGFGRLVPQLAGHDVPLGGAQSPVSTEPGAIERVAKWLQTRSQWEVPRQPTR